ncbi:hypothetical protein N7G274_000125 [Stereocaulon virgatum]|uniref:Peptidase S26 domain-containing protein n=1 Tax=Stereocaulon virgatum TaxID=373712 RepID=A0ABR4AUB5_9LECA
MPTFPLPSTTALSREYIRLSLFLLKFGLITHFTLSHIGTLTPTTGPSMLPTISVRGDVMYTNKLYTRGNGIKLGDLVDFKHPLVVGEAGCKRVMGLGGDFVCDGEEGAGRMIQVPEGHCWVLGDNLSASRDSRTYGPLPLALIKGRVTARIWPLSAVGWMKNTLQRPEDGI